MQKHLLLLAPLLLLCLDVPADGQADLAGLVEQRHQEVRQIHQTTREQRARLRALEQLIEARREANRRLDRQLDQRLRDAAGLPSSADGTGNETGPHPAD